MNKGSRETREELELPDQENTRTVKEKENNKSLEILEVNTIGPTEIKEKVRKRYIERTRKFLENKICNRNFIKGINILVVLQITDDKKEEGTGLTSMED